MRSRRLITLLGSIAAIAIVVAGCGSSSSSSGSSTSPSAKGHVVIGTAGFTEINLMAQMYADLLQKAGYTTEIKTSPNREVYEPALQNGQIDVVPDYAATMTEFLNQKINGTNAKTMATNNPTTTAAALNSLLKPLGMIALTPASAVDENAFAVTQAFATQHSLKTLSDLGASGQTVTLAAAAECPQRPFCGEGLKSTYGIKIGKYLSTGFDTTQTKQAVKNGQAQLGLVATTDATLSQFGLVALTDDKNLQLADALIPVVGKKYANDPDLAAALNKLSAVLTTSDLAQLDAAVDAQHNTVAAVAQGYLSAKGLV